jgi:hypothetical protein
MCRTILVFGIAATWIAILFAMEASLNRNEPKCWYDGGQAFSCGEGSLAFLK